MMLVLVFEYDAFLFFFFFITQKTVKGGNNVLATYSIITLQGLVPVFTLYSTVSHRMSRRAVTILSCAISVTSYHISSNPY